MQTKPSDAAKVARVFLARPDDRQHLYPLGKLAGRRLIHVGRVLNRFMEIGWIEDGWEDGADERWRRRYYVLTDLGRREMPSLLVRSEV